MTASAMPLSPAPRQPRRSEAPEPLRRRRLPKPPAPPWRRRAVNYLLVFIIVVLVVDGLVGENGLLQRLRARDQAAAQHAAISSLRAENQALRAEIRRLREDPGAIELLARGELGLIRPGEVLFIIRDARPAQR